MSFFQTPLRRMYVVHAVGMLVLAIAMIAFSTLDDYVDSDGRIFAYALAGLCVAGGIVSIWRAYQAPAGAFAVLPEHGPPSAQVQHYRRALGLSAVAFPVATAVVACDLHRLEWGAVTSVSIWEPFATVYRHFGFWPAVLAVPLLGLVCSTVLLIRLRGLSAPSTAERASRRASP